MLGAVQRVFYVFWAFLSSQQHRSSLDALQCPWSQSVPAGSLPPEPVPAPFVPHPASQRARMGETGETERECAKKDHLRKLVSPARPPCSFSASRSSGRLSELTSFGTDGVLTPHANPQLGQEMARLLFFCGAAGR